MYEQMRQGDVLIERVEVIPPGLTTTQNRIAALGETSGHGHVIDGDVDVYETPEGLYVDVKTADAAVRHLLVDSGVWTREHVEIPIEPGIYFISRQSERNPYQNAMRFVAD